uniref:Uncharacterized protein n=1 Tax=Arundo donax TaxID=35708 RepID=A0A0A9DZG5_ARUDO
MSLWVPSCLTAGRDRHMSDLLLHSLLVINLPMDIFLLILKILL